jgi:predicted  nucleic acid-binding Zn-ribbon protein
VTFTDICTVTSQEPPLKADPNAQLKLLDLASIDARINQLTHQLATIPEAAELAALDAGRTALVDRVRDARILVDDLNKEQKRADNDVEAVKARRERDRSRMEQGLITNPKDLERMAHELESLERRIRNLEDEELEVMERLEAAQMELGFATAEVEAANERREPLEAARSEKAASLEKALADAAGDRTWATSDLPADLLALYERIRAKQVIGAAELRARECGGCRLTLNALEMAAISKKPADEVIRCEECDRILVRTPESGLA